jgi:hypothetical protein
VFTEVHILSTVTFSEQVDGGNIRIRKGIKGKEFEVFTAVTMKNVVFWDMRNQFVPHRRHIASPLQSPDG